MSFSQLCSMGTTQMLQCVLSAAVATFGLYLMSMWLQAYFKGIIHTVPISLRVDLCLQHTFALSHDDMISQKRTE